jgi:hypothetical protein
MILDFDSNEKNNKKLVEFLIFLNELQGQQDFFYTKEQLIQLETYKVLLFDYFLSNYQNLYLTLFINFLNFDISSEEFVSQFFALQLNHLQEFDELMSQLDTDSAEFFNKFSSLLNNFSIEGNIFMFKEILELVELSCKTFVSGSSGNNELRQQVEKIFLLITTDSDSFFNNQGC